jgi:hypothetical protein
LNSLWLRPTDDSRPTVCAVSFNYSTVDTAVTDFNGDGLLGLKASASEVLMETLVRRTSHGARASVFLGGLTPGHDYRVRDATGRCGHPVGKVPLSITLTEVLVSVYHSAHVTLGQEQLDSVRSVRVLDTNTGHLHLCAPAVIMANTEGDFH